MCLDKVDKKVPLIIDEAMLYFEQFKWLLSVFNKDKREIIVVPRQCLCKVKDAYVPIPAEHFIPELKWIKDSSLTDCLFSAKLLHYIRETLLPYKSKTVFPKRVFLYRDSAHRIFNQDEVYAALHPLGFEIVRFNNMSVPDQIALFNNAEFIVTGSGAFCTNLLFAQKGAKMLCIVNMFLKENTCFSSIAKIAGCEMLYMR